MGHIRQGRFLLVGLLVHYCLPPDPESLTILTIIFNKGSDIMIVAHAPPSDKWAVRAAESYRNCGAGTIRGAESLESGVLSLEERPRRERLSFLPSPISPQFLQTPDSRL